MIELGHQKLIRTGVKKQGEKLFSGVLMISNRLAQQLGRPQGPFTLTGICEHGFPLANNELFLA